MDTSLELTKALDDCNDVAINKVLNIKKSKHKDISILDIFFKDGSIIQYASKGNDIEKEFASILVKPFVFYEKLFKRRWKWQRKKKKKKQ